MYGIDVLVDEHNNIERFLKLIQKACLKTLETGQLDYGFFRDGVDFIKNYADKIHHGKEEDLLFKEVTEEMGKIGETLVKNGMLVEHDLARLTVINLESSLDQYQTHKSPESILDVISYSMSYRDLLTRHIEKENQVLYPFAEKSLDRDILLGLDQATKESELKFEKDKANYLEILDRYENIYL